MVLSTPSYLHHLRQFLASYLEKFGEQVPLTVVHTGGLAPELPPGIRLIAQDQLLGCGAARELGRRIIRAAWTLYTDCDVLFPDNFVQTVFDTIQHAEIKGIDAVQLDFKASNPTKWGHFEFLLDKLVILNRSKQSTKNDWWEAQSFDLPPSQDFFIELTCMQGFGMLIRSDAVEAVGGFDPSLDSGEDRDIAVRLIKSHRRIGLTIKCFLFHSYDFGLIRILRRKIWHGRFSALTSAKHPDEFPNSIGSCLRLMFIAATFPPLPFRSLQGRVYFSLQAIAFGSAHILNSILLCWYRLTRNFSHW